ncbi:transcription factor tfiia complex subunit [Grosmannia clavigera kw1407]|uniref:Transcription factor tfiia complex subunit n=1 Tax=Grosmannia clavigera (strain kw1407 / UAMH 11150) TaxID=655863 RepID=F0XAM5_GROCL|nr:transcription factor tfiia complex subunit [Grosmannia clavigera kw1407]EFX06087.1 transcription factor tfiia complex subunit [Grosmannia clavigera kw1407]
MSNNVVGGVYQSIIEEVMTTSHVDFEENGVEESVLEDLCKGWKNKLSQFNVAQFPWDPKPDQEQLHNVGQGSAPTNSNGPLGVVPSPTTTHHMDTSFSQTITSPVSSSQGLSMSLPMPSFEPAVAKAEDMDHGIKMEPEMHHGSGLSGVPPAAHGQGPAMQNYTTPQHGGGNAAARAVQQLQNTFGQRAAASINAIHSGMSQSNPQQQMGQRLGPNGQVQQQPLNAQQYRAQLAAHQAAAQMNGANGISRSQMDGADDGDNGGEAPFFEGVLMQQRVAGQPPVELGRIEIDNMLHEQMALRAKQMEGGGLMLPLRQAAKQKRSAKASAAAPSQRSRVAGTIAQTDGADDDDDEAKVVDDEDAINSDLDDPDEDREDDDDEDDVMGPIMLCVYDKVQRVKNKWKCTLKDGVLTVNGKEYVFHKATGEYEW